MKKAIKKLIRTKKDAIAKLVAPKVVTAFTNVIRMGPRIIFRSTVELMRANLITRIISCVSLLVIDLIDLSRNRISKAQFVKNVILSALLVVSGTLGWELGTRWLSVELSAILVLEIFVGIIGAGVASLGTNWIACKVSDKYIRSDSDLMWDILDPHILKLSQEEQEYVREYITTKCLKGMYACNDREAYGIELINKLKNREKIEGKLKPPKHKIVSTY